VSFSNDPPPQRTTNNERNQKSLALNSIALTICTLDFVVCDCDENGDFFRFGVQKHDNSTQDFGENHCIGRVWVRANENTDMQMTRRLLTEIFFFFFFFFSSVGKTSLLLRYVENSFTIATKSTIGADFLSKQIDVDGKPVTLQIWVRRKSFTDAIQNQSRAFVHSLFFLFQDTAGQERFQGLGTSFFRGADGVIFVFDVTRQSTFDELGPWMKSFLIQTNQEGNTAFPMLVLANKVDLDDRVVTRKQCEQWCDQLNIPFYETSAKEAINVDKAFEEITRLVLSKTKEDDLHYDSVDLDLGAKKKSDCPC
jgi:Ras-related protein Rab-7A